MRLFGLIGYPLEHSFSPRYFAEKFFREGIAGAEYRLFPLERIEEFPDLLATEPALCGLNVTIPYKEQIQPYVHGLSPAAKAIGAVNTIRFERSSSGLWLEGHNTDWIGFAEHIAPQLPESAENALVLGTGGSAKAVHYAFSQLGLKSFSVSRRPGPDVDFTYGELSPAIVRDHTVIVNCTPLGMHPAVHGFPDLPYAALGPGHLLYDLVYNPDPTVFLIKGRQQGAATSSGLGMLYGQAEAAWRIWNGLSETEEEAGADPQEDDSQG